MHPILQLIPAREMYTFIVHSRNLFAGMNYALIDSCKSKSGICRFLQTKIRNLLIPANQKRDYLPIYRLFSPEDIQFIIIAVKKNLSVVHNI